MRKTIPLLTGGQALIQSLKREGVQVVFGVPGHGQYEAVDALAQEPDIRYVSVRHEQAATYMADGYARVSGQIAAALVVAGPGLFNASAGIATANAVSSPMLVVTGTGHYDRCGADGDGANWLQGLTKWAGRAERPSQIPAAVRTAFRQLRSGRPGPVAIEISPQVFAATEEVELLQPAPSLEVSPDDGVSALEGIERAAQMLAISKRPLVWAGGGVQRAGAAAQLQELAEYLQAPVVTTRQGKGALSDRHPLCLGLAELRYEPLRQWLADRDVILAIGVSQDFSGYAQEIIQIDVDEDRFRPQHGRDPNIQAIAVDARVGLEALCQALISAIPPRADEGVTAEVRALNAARFDPSVQLQPQWDLMCAVRAAMPDDGILVQGMSQMGYYSRNYYPVYAPRTYLTASSQSTLGCAYPLALGAKIALPERATVALSGDGGFLYNSQELATAVQYGLNAVVIVFNDNAYGNVLRAQIEEFDGRILGTQLHNPDFVQLARAYGVHAVRTRSAVELGSALREALSMDAPTLIEAPVGRMERYF